MGGVAETSTSPSHLYSQTLQLKLYQAFIFSIPVLFSIILFLLFYLFYLKRRTASLSHPHPSQLLPRSSDPSTTNPDVSSLGVWDLKLELVDKLPKVLFDEELGAQDPQCCVCLGDFEVEEALLQIPDCKHIFHVECIYHWLQSHWTCPLCRSSVIPIKYLKGNANAIAATASTPPYAIAAAASTPPPTSTLMESEQVVTLHMPRSSVDS